MLARILIPLIFLMANAQLVNATEPVRVNYDAHKYYIGLHSDYLEDAQKKWTLSDISSKAISDRFIPLDKEFPSFGFTTSAYWLRAHIVNTTNSTQNMILENEIPWIDLIEIYIQKDNGEYIVKRAGDSLPFYDREIIHQEFLFNITLEPEEEITLFIRAESRDPLIMPLILWKHSAFENSDQLTSYFYGFLFGVLVVMLFYNLFLYLALRDRNYLFYVIYLLSIILFIFTYKGFSYQYLWPGSTWLATNILGSIGGMTWFFAVLFTRQFLGTHKILPKMDKILGILMYAMLLHSVLLIVIPKSFITSVGLSITLLSSLAFPLLLVAGVMAWRNGNRAARYFLLAWIGVLVGSLSISLISAGFIQYTFILGHLNEIGYLLDVTLLSLALADRINILQTQKDEAQKLARETLQKSKEELEVRVSERTAELLKQKERAEKATKLKNQFMSLVAHDLRSPLASVSSMLDMAEKYGDEKQHEKRSGFILRAKESCKGLLDMIEELLNVNRIESGEIELKRDSYGFNNYKILCVSHFSSGR